MFIIKKATPALEAMLSKHNPIMTLAFNVSTKDTYFTWAGTPNQ